MGKFDLKSPWPPTGDQPQAVKKLVSGLKNNNQFQTLLGATGTGKTFTMANVVAEVNKPTLVISHNKTLAAQLASEFRGFFPNNAVEYFVSYYDYYQPESYVPQIDLYIEKDSAINEEIDRLRLATTKSLLTRKDVLIVASVSCIYNIGNPQAYMDSTLSLQKGQVIPINKIKEQLVRLQYQRNDMDLARATFRIKGDMLEIYPAYEEFALRVSIFGDKIEKIVKINTTSFETLEEVEEISIFPAKHYNVPSNLPYDPLDQIKKEFETWSAKLKKENKLVELQRLTSRVKYDLEMIKETGSVKGIENYSRFFDGRSPGEPPYTLMDYFPKDFLIFVDESHMTLPQIRAMGLGEKKRKETLIENGFRLPSAMDNRPLSYDEYMRKINQAIFVSATPTDYEISLSSQVVQQIIRPTGVIDPYIEIRKTEGQIPDLIKEIKERVKKGQRVLVTTLTKRMAEDLSEYLQEKEIKVVYIHHMVDTLERVEILRDLRKGKYDVLVGINLLREGLDLPEVSLVVILDADKEGFLRSRTSLVQTTGRAARHVEGKVIMYADVKTKSMKEAIDETNRRREIQLEYNKKHKITPETIKKAIHDISERLEEIQPEAETAQELDLTKIPQDQVKLLLRDLNNEMKIAAEHTEFERAALLRDQIQEIKNQQLEIPKTITAQQAKKIIKNS